MIPRRISIIYRDDFTFSFSVRHLGRQRAQGPLGLSHCEIAASAAGDQDSQAGQVLARSVTIIFISTIFLYFYYCFFR